MRSHISLAVSSCLYMADAISEKERRSRGFELACVEREGGRHQREGAAKPWIRAGMCGAGRRTPSARRSGEAVDSSWHVWSGKADAISEKERRSRGFELACVEREGGRHQREGATEARLRAGMCGGRRTPSARRSDGGATSSWHVWSGKAEAISEKERRSRGFELAWKKPPAFDGRLCL